MTTELGLTWEFVANLAGSASYEYKKFIVRKKSGGLREIFHPSRKLKAVQIWLLRNLLGQLPVHESATAYRTGISIYDNATRHTKSRYLLRIDLENFFPSIRDSDFSAYVDSNQENFKGWTEIDKAIVTSLMFRNGELTIGAPTSPALSNALCFQLDVQLSKLANNRGLVYTRYADDLFFSSIKPGVLSSVLDEAQSIIDELPIPATLKINRAKTRHSSKKGRRQVTGIVLGSDGKPHISRTFKRSIRSMVHKFDLLREDQKVALPGMISFVAGEEPGFLNSLITKYGFELIARVTTIQSLAERQRIHLPKVKPSPPKKVRAKSSTQVLFDTLRNAGFDVDD
ncbi:retron St85 family RNA-directed DNA polymerase [Tunturiibacter gelidoferens]|uniref:RNA-directed DNA polymerase n=1 Tax=Tunturiibacter gelidiferens TaxID=3069689 RepID=A0A9X0QCY7_9BACT|nr:retron St85 family RNA-directed DNA polymerase [Edaphobacter lichenicola]MBB5328127.1 RNA-directed DNA polymerase [Edaphobacter lichenicola]